LEATGGAEEEAGTGAEGDGHGKLLGDEPLKTDI